ncbi:hypothetical protein HYR54_15615 [Candidatus Acetothermia bacterium]|nr:hypothetical protein [Candidatus Acetothermia bacterium]
MSKQEPPCCGGGDYAEIERGVSRRGFLKLWTAVLAMLGLTRFAASGEAGASAVGPRPVPSGPAQIVPLQVDLKKCFAAWQKCNQQCDQLLKRCQDQFNKCLAKCKADFNKAVADCNKNHKRGTPEWAACLKTAMEQLNACEAQCVQDFQACTRQVEQCRQQCIDAYKKCAGL